MSVETYSLAEIHRPSTGPGRYGSNSPLPGEGGGRMLNAPGWDGDGGDGDALCALGVVADDRLRRLARRACRGGVSGLVWAAGQRVASACAVGQPTSLPVTVDSGSATVTLKWG